jgi:peptidoglycan/xylan/chitin deacetylase (PgdA/CDA1 family)
MSIVKTPKLVQQLFGSLLWQVETTRKEIYVTFDDGPIPEVTPWVLQQLKKYHAKATFFCIGNNIQQHPAIFQQVVNDGHSVGNHTMNHLNTFTTGSKKYLANIEECQELLKDYNTNLFRPPYGKFKPIQIKTIAKKYKVVLWDVLSRDFDLKTSNEDCLNNVLKNAKEGSIIVFHDSIKAQEKLKYTLPKVLEHYSKLGFEFKAL